jgi:murein DD-endopeptidase MepM/ murein hydrolase activator NlpD
MIVLLTVAAIAAMSAAADQSLRVSVQARAIQPGELVVLTVTAVEPVAAIRASAFDRLLPAYAVDPTTWRVLAAIDLDVKPGRHTVSIEADGATAERVTHTLAVTAKQFGTRTLTVNPAFVNPPESARQRIREESELLARVFASLSRDRLWRGAFVRPVPHQANSAFGRRSVFNGEPRSAHTGADFLSPAGTPVKAPNAGRIVLARDLYYSGRTVIIDHGLGMASHLAHLSAIDVVEGATVAAGDIVGKVGATGRVTGAHLHWSVRVGPARVDPLSVLSVLGSSSGPGLPGRSSPLDVRFRDRP